VDCIGTVLEAVGCPPPRIGKQCLKIRREGKIRTKAILSVFEKIGEI
jgi:hypothetical protein